MAKKLGIYFGTNKISVVEIESGRITAQANLSLPEVIVQAQDKSAGAISDETKQAVAIQDTLALNKIEARNAFVGLAGRDLFIRGFQMPSLSKTEMAAGVRFEAKKYIPFKTEELVFDYQYRINKRLSKMDILFTAIVKSNIEKYVNLLEQANIQINSIEPTNFAIFRLLHITKQFVPRLSCAMVTVQNEYIELSIFSEGFPCFSREIKLSQAPVSSAALAESEEAPFHARLAGEIRVSLDYFRRQFSGHTINKILILTKDIREDLASDLGKGLNLPVEWVDLSKDPKLSTLADLDMLKAYALALRDITRINLTVDLYKKKSYTRVAQYGTAQEAKKVTFNLNMMWQPLALAMGLVFLAYIIPIDELSKLAGKSNRLKKDASDLLGDSFGKLSMDQLKQKKTEYSQRFSVLEKLLNSRIDITPAYNALPVIVKTGLWFEELDIVIKDGKKKLGIKGAVYLADGRLEEALVKEVLENLKKNTEFMRGLKGLNLSSVGKNKRDDYAITTFEISGG